jgi:AhpD family alkylhydroperoxidase
MALIDYPTDDELQRAGPVLDEIRQGRGEIPNLYRMLLHSPGLVEGWVQFANRVRFASSLPDRSRELAILLIADLTACEYEWHHHSQIAVRTGLTAAEVEAVRRWPDGAAAWKPLDRAVLQFTAAAVEREPVPPTAVDEVRALLGERGVVDLGATVAYYLGLAHLLLAFDIELEDTA